MTKKVLGYITMNAGDGIPGSILKWALQNYAHRFDYSVVVDGNLTPEASAFYATIPNLKVIDSPWTGAQLPQYYARENVVDEGDWILALDDDEFPSEGLMNLVDQIDKINEKVNIAYIPSLTYLCVDKSNNFWRVQESPSQEDWLRRSKRILYKKIKDRNYYISSPCGMHVTPTITDQSRTRSDETPVGHPQAFFFHIKTVESFIWNECIYNVSNPRHESGPQARQMTDTQELEFERLVNKYGLRNIKHFKELTSSHSWPDDFKNFVYQFKDNLGLAMSKFYYAYEYISHGDLSKTTDLILCISKGFIPVFDEVIRTKEQPLVIPRTPNIW
jgi:hypothetical protein